MAKQTLIPSNYFCKIPALYAQEDARDATVHVRLFTPWAGWTWLLTEYDRKERLAFGYCYNAFAPHDAELGYVSIEELESVKGPFGLFIERDVCFEPMPLSEAKRLYF
jgi:hypothetical protein